MKVLLLRTKTLSQSTVDRNRKFKELWRLQLTLPYDNISRIIHQEDLWNNMGLRAYQESNPVVSGVLVFLERLSACTLIKFIWKNVTLQFPTRFHKQDSQER